MDAVILTPMDPGILYLGKMLANLLFILVAELVVVLVTVIWFNLPFESLNGWLFLSIFLGTLGYVAVGTLFAAIAVNTRMREVMLPIFHFPVAVPVFIYAVGATSGSLRGQPVEDFSYELQMLVSIGIIFTVVSYMLFEFVTEE